MSIFQEINHILKKLSMGNDQVLEKLPEESKDKVPAKESTGSNSPLDHKFSGGKKEVFDTQTSGGLFAKSHKPSKKPVWIMPVR